MSALPTQASVCSFQLSSCTLHDDRYSSNNNNNKHAGVLVLQFCLILLSQQPQQHAQCWANHSVTCAYTGKPTQQKAAAATTDSSDTMQTANGPEQPNTMLHQNSWKCMCAASVDQFRQQQAPTPRCASAGPVLQCRTQETQLLSVMQSALECIS